MAILFDLVLPLQIVVTYTPEHTINEDPINIVTDNIAIMDNNNQPEDVEKINHPQPPKARNVTM